MRYELSCPLIMTFTLFLAMNLNQVNKLLQLEAVNVFRIEEEIFHSHEIDLI